MSKNQFISFSPYSRSKYARIVSQIAKGESPGIPLESYAQGNLVNSVALNIPSYKNREGIDYDWILELELILNEARDRDLLISDVIIHGSFGDLTPTRFSDLELTIVLSAQRGGRIESDKNFKKWLSNDLNPFILRIDPLQHHGVFFLWDDLLNKYNENILPVSAYQDCWSLNSCQLTFSIMEPDLEEGKQALDATLRSLKDCHLSFFRHGVNPYTIKRFISNIVLVPALLYQSAGIFMSKAEAIYNIISFDIREINKTIDLATLCRNSWPPSPRWLGFARGMITNQTIPRGRLDSYLVRTYRHREIEDFVIKELIPTVPDFCESINQHKDYLCKP